MYGNQHGYRRLHPIFRSRITRQRISLLSQLPRGLPITDHDSLQRPSSADQFRTMVVGFRASRPSGATRRKRSPSDDGTYLLRAMPGWTVAAKRGWGIPALKLSPAWMSTAMSF